MGYTISPSDDGQYIVITVVGDLTRAIAEEVVGAGLVLGAKLGIRCYLNDFTRSRNVERVRENVRFTLEDATPTDALDPHACVSVLVDPADHSHDFYVAFAQSRGVDISLFWDRDSAVRHLLEAAARLNPTPPDGS
jgi:hypothetical protein